MGTGNKSTRIVAWTFFLKMIKRSGEKKGGINS